MGTRCSQMGVRITKDARHLVAECDDCDWTSTLNVQTSNTTRTFYDQAKDHVRTTGHVVNLAHTHAVEYRPLR